MLLREVDAEYGFFARLISTGKDAANVSKAPVLKILSYTNIAWNKRFADGNTQFSPFIKNLDAKWASYETNGSF